MTAYSSSIFPADPTRTRRPVGPGPAPSLDSTFMFAVWAYSGFLLKQEAAAHRQTLVDQYIPAFRHVESSVPNDAKISLKALSTEISARVVSEQHGALLTLVDSRLAKLS